MADASPSVLIVDDSTVILRTMRKLVEREGFAPGSVHTASSGEEALAMFSAVEPDIVFLDVELDGIDGEVTGHEIFHQDPETHIVIITGQDIADDRVKRMIAQGAFAVLEKPIRAEALEDVVRLVDRERSGAGRIA